MSNVSDLVKPTPQLERARKLLQARVDGKMQVPPSVMPEITDQECALLAFEFEVHFEYDAIRKAFAKRLEEKRA